MEKSKMAIKLTAFVAMTLCFPWFRHIAHISPPANEMIEGFFVEGKICITDLVTIFLSVFRPLHNVYQINRI